MMFTQTKIEFFSNHETTPKLAITFGCSEFSFCCLLFPIEFIARLNTHAGFIAESFFMILIY